MSEKKLTIIVDDNSDNKCNNHCDNEYNTQEYNLKCSHCSKPITELHAPLTCGCIICNCLCPNWSQCPKMDKE